MLIDALRCAPDVPRLSAPPAQIARQFRYWRVRILYSTVIGYAVYYFVRTNISIAVPAMQQDLGLTKAQLGLVMTLGLSVYGASKFVNGLLGDRCNPRFFMALGLICSAGMNIGFGMSSGLTSLAGFWLTNGWFQGMGFPPCARSMSHWFAPSERSSSFALWNSGHQIGAAGVAVLAGYLVGFGWRWCFFVPAGIAILGSVFLLDRLRDAPGSLGLPPVEEYRGEVPAATSTADGHWRFVLRHVLGDKFVWIVSIANFFVYTLRYAMLNWAPSFLSQFKGTSLQAAGWLSAGSEIAGMIGAIVGGVVTDRLLGGRAGRTCLAATVLLMVAVFAFWKSPGTSTWLCATFFLFMGFLVYIPQLLIAVIAMNIATKRAAAAAVGLTGIFGYASSVLSGWGVGRLVDHFGWDAAFVLMIGCCAVMGALFVLTWNVGPERVR
ncbi:MAG: MFS transporter [Tepidisphaeraceae bacterium]